MDSGNFSNQPKRLLSIAIPTWNRSKYISKSLSVLIPQLNNFSEFVELIISDNASEDDTLSVIDDFLNNNSVNFRLTILQSSKNTGFFGNFSKCMINSNGEYFWLLSDDDYIVDNLIETVLSILQNKDIGAIFLKDWISNTSEIKPQKITYLNQNLFFSGDLYRHSLISSIIHKNKISENYFLLELLNGNALIGYSFFMNSIKEYNKFVEISGGSLISRLDTSVRFNGLEIFTFDLNECLKQLKSIYDKKTIAIIYNSFLKTNVKLYFKLFKFSNNNNTKYDIKQLFSFFFLYKNFWIYLFPLIICPRNLYFFQRKIRNVPKYYEI